jgi:hypothetical protein
MPATLDPLFMSGVTRVLAATVAELAEAEQ